VERRSADLQTISKEIAGPLYKFLPLLLSPSFALMGYLDGWLTSADLRAAARHQIPPSVSLEEVGKCVANMHTQGGNFLGVLHSMGYTRGLLTSIDYPERLRLQSLARYAVLGLLSAPQRKRALLEGGMKHALSPVLLRRLRQASFQVDVSRYLMTAVLSALAFVRVLCGSVVAAVIAYVLALLLTQLGVPVGLASVSLQDDATPGGMRALMGLVFRKPSWGLRGGSRDS